MIVPIEINELTIVSGWQQIYHCISKESCFLIRKVMTRVIYICLRFNPIWGMHKTLVHEKIFGLYFLVKGQLLIGISHMWLLDLIQFNPLHFCCIHTSGCKIYFNWQMNITIFIFYLWFSMLQSICEKETQQLPTSKQKFMHYQM